MPFKVTDLVLTIDINSHRDQGNIQLVGDGKQIAQAAIESCGRTNHPINIMEPGLAFAGKLVSTTELDALKAQLRALLEKLDNVELQHRAGP